MKKVILVVVSLLTGIVAGAGAVGKIMGNSLTKSKRLSDKHLALFLMMNQWVKVKQEGKHLTEYFEKNGITNIAIYGLGNYGKIIIEELRKSKRIKLYGVDQKIKEMAGIEIGMLEEVNRKCDDIIVTPVKDNKSIVKSVRKVWNGNVWGLNTLLQKIKSMYYI